MQVCTACQPTNFTSCKLTIEIRNGNVVVVIERERARERERERAIERAMKDALLLFLFLTVWNSLAGKGGERCTLTQRR